MALTWLKLWFRRFSPLEDQLLAAVRAILPAAAQSTYDTQVRAITRVQRHPSWTEIIFYRIKKGKVDWSDVPSFPRSDEFYLAEIKFSVHGKRYKATLSSIAGHIAIFSIVPRPKEITFERWDGPPATRILDDPLRAPTGRKPGETISSTWREFLAEKSESAGEDWILYDETTTYRVPTDAGECVVLAERNGDEFVLQDMPAEPEAGEPERLLYLASHDGTPVPIRGTLKEFMKRLKKK